MWMWMWDFVQETARKWKHRAKHITHFDNLPNEIILMICRYLSPAHILYAFDHYNRRLSFCVSQYREHIDLTKSSYGDMNFFLSLFIKNDFQPSILTISNTRIPIQVETFFNMCGTAFEFCPNNVHQLSLLGCKLKNLYYTISCLKNFKSLKSLHIVESTSKGNSYSINYGNIEELRDLIFNNSFTMLTVLELMINDGIILDKQLPPQIHLQQLTISLQNINDLYLLLDGLVPKLTILNVTLCQSNPYKQSSLPKDWPHQYMSHLIEFQLITHENVEINFDQLRHIVMPLKQLKTLTLYIQQWISNDRRFIDGHQLQMLFDQFMPQLHHFQCSINTNDDIDMKTFINLNERWPIKCRLESINSFKHLYTSPWSFTHLHTSMLADDDTISICPNVQYLTVDVPYTNLSHRFPNIHTLTISNECNLSQDNSMGFHRLRHLTVKNINIVPSSIIKHLHTLTLFETNELLTHSIIYPNIQHLYVKNNRMESLPIINAIVKNFPHLDSLEIQLEPNTDYYTNLNMLLDKKHLPYLRLLKTNWLDRESHCSNINLWLAAKTSLKWQSTPFYGYRDQKELIVCL